MVITYQPLALATQDGRPPRDYPVSIILVNYHSRPQLERCLQSLYADTSSSVHQVIVVDNSIEPELGGMTAQYPNLVILANANNPGFGAGCNLGASLAQGDTLVFLNPDTVVAPGWLQPLLAALYNDRQVGLVTPAILLGDQPERINAAGNDIHLSGLTLCRRAGRQRAQVVAEDVPAISGAAFAIRRELFTALGGFDPEFFLYLEDTDLSWRARLAGYRCRVVPEAVVFHDYQLRFRQRKIFYQERNRYLMLLKNNHWASLILLGPALLLAEVITWGYVLLHQRGQWRDKLDAHAWIVRHWPVVMAKRRAAQALRGRSDRSLLRLHTTRLEFEQTGASTLTRLAHWVFDPLFWGLRQLALGLIWW